MNIINFTYLLNKSEALIPSLIALAGAVISISVSLLIVQRQLFQADTKIYKEMITSERMKWLTLQRETIVQLLELSDSIIANPHSPMTRENIVKLNRLCNEIILRLNPQETEFMNSVALFQNEVLSIENYLKNNDISSYLEKISKVRKLFVSESQKLIKKEWEVIKDEARPSGKIKKRMC